MTSSNNEDAEAYCNHFQSQYNFLNECNNDLHVKILSVTLLSALARGCYPDKKDGERFVQLIEDHSNWLDTQRVSIPQLALQIKLNPKFLGKIDTLVSNAKPLIDRVEGKSTTAWEISDDPNIETISNWASDQDQEQLLVSCKLSSLIYQYRCRLIHEYRVPGYAFEFNDRKDPYYISTTDRDTNVVTFELAFPNTWLLLLLSNILDSLKEYYLTNNIDPYERYDFGSHWKEIGKI